MLRQARVLPRRVQTLAQTRRSAATAATQGSARPSSAALQPDMIIDAKAGGDAAAVAGASAKFRRRSWRETLMQHRQAFINTFFASALFALSLRLATEAGHRRKEEEQHAEEVAALKQQLDVAARAAADATLSYAQQASIAEQASEETLTLALPDVLRSAGVADAAVVQRVVANASLAYKTRHEQLTKLADAVAGDMDDSGAPGRGDAAPQPSAVW